MICHSPSVAKGGRYDVPPMSFGPRLWLCVAPIAACWADVAATFLGQGRAYWRGDYAAATEFNPLARLLLQLHPLAFAAAAAGSCALVAGGVVLLNRQFALVLAFVVTFCHTVAAAAWAARAGPAGLAGAVVLLVAAERCSPFRGDNPGRAPKGNRTRFDSCCSGGWRSTGRRERGTG